MRTIRTAAEMHAHALRVREDGATIALVPTMGAFHAGHHSLIRAARERADEVVVSLFVNPRQFEEGADLAAYPRDETRDAAEAAKLGADVLYAPPVEEVYPAGSPPACASRACPTSSKGPSAAPATSPASARSSAKLLNVVAPDVALFGQKDAQQVAVLRRMVRDLDIPVTLAVLPTVRDADGLALSSRNVHLSAAERTQALALSRALQAAEAAAAGGAGDPEALRAAAAAELDGVEPEYLAVLDPDTFQPITESSGRVLVAVAARFGSTRLIDNTIIHTAATRQRAPTTQEA